jgi:hypothetical protein
VKEEFENTASKIKVRQIKRKLVKVPGDFKMTLARVANLSSL